MKQVALVVLALLGMTLMTPTPVAACLCGGPPETGEVALGPNSVVFVGRVTEETELAPRARPDGNGQVSGFVYSFQVDHALHGNPGEGKVYTTGSPSSCGLRFEIGATYEVHAQAVDPEAPFFGAPPTVPLVTDDCGGGNRQLSDPVDPPSDNLALAIGLGGLALVGAVSAYVFRRR